MPGEDFNDLFRESKKEALNKLAYEYKVKAPPDIVDVSKYLNSSIRSAKLTLYQHALDWMAENIEGKWDHQDSFFNLYISFELASDMVQFKLRWTP